MFNECFEEVSIKCFKQVSSKFQAHFQCFSSKIDEFLREIKGLLREFQGHCKKDKEVSVVFRECFKEVYRCV